MNRLRRILSVLLVLGLALGTTMQVAPRGMAADMAGMTGIAAAADHGDMPACRDCAPGQSTVEGMEMDGCRGGICIVLPGLLPPSPASLRVAPDTVVADAASFPGSLSPPPDHRPPISASLA